MPSHPAAHNHVTPPAPTGSLKALERELVCAERELAGCLRQADELRAAVARKRREHHLSSLSSNPQNPTV